jgi:hypothetical protein
MAAPISDSGPPTAGWLSKSNSRLSMFRHLRQALAQRIEADDMSIHLADAHGHRVHAALQFALSSLISDCCSARVADQVAMPHPGRCGSHRS